MSHDEIIREKGRQYAMDGEWGNTSEDGDKKKRKCICIIAAGDRGQCLHSKHPSDVS
jgi:hypothetical protein